jgi:hypothetical protein
MARGHTGTTTEPLAPKCLTLTVGAGATHTTGRAGTL